MFGLGQFTIYDGAPFQTDENLNQKDADDSKTYRWGYNVAKQRYGRGSSRSMLRIIQLAKLLLIDSKHTKYDQETLRLPLAHLIDLKLIRKHSDLSEKKTRKLKAIEVLNLLSDFLCFILYHVKQQITKYARYTEEFPVEFAMAVPAIWSTGSTRILEEAMEIALQSTGLGRLKHETIENLTLVSKPEAVCTYFTSKEDTIEVSAKSPVD